MARANSVQSSAISDAPMIFAIQRFCISISSFGSRQKIIHLQHLKLQIGVKQPNSRNNDLV